MGASMTGWGEQTCLYITSHDDSSTLAGCVPSDRFPFRAKAPEEAVPQKWLIASGSLPRLPHV